MVSACFPNASLSTFQPSGSNILRVQSSGNLPWSDALRQTGSDSFNSDPCTRLNGLLACTRRSRST
jgi:hypothetical protein